jgi:hypothetical protein
MRGTSEWWALEIAAARSAVVILTENKASIKDGEACLNRAMAGLVAVQRRYRQAMKEGRVRGTENQRQASFNL